jgi:TPR repeat protein
MTSAALCAPVAVWLLAAAVTGIALAQDGGLGSRTPRFNDATRELSETGRASDFDKAVRAYERGDYPTALRLLRPLASGGNADAQNNLGLMYATGRGVQQDYTVAAKWYRMAADKGVSSAQNNLGVMYAGGQGVQQDYVQAHMWFTLAASGFAASEAAERSAVVKNRDAVAADMTPAQLAEAQKLAREWKRR